MSTFANDRVVKVATKNAIRNGNAMLKALPKDARMAEILTSTLAVLETQLNACRERAETPGVARDVDEAIAALKALVNCRIVRTMAIAEVDRIAKMIAESN